MTLTSLCNACRPDSQHRRDDHATVELPKLIVVVAVDADEEGDMQPVFSPAEQ